MHYIHGTIDLTCELAQAAYIIITAIILSKERTIKVSQREQIREIEVDKPTNTVYFFFSFIASFLDLTRNYIFT